MQDAPNEKRRSNREKVILAARCRKYSGAMENVIVSDVSAHGCRIYSDDMALRVGQRLTIQPAKLEGIAGEVRWVEGKRAGVSFERPLHDAVAEHLQREYAVPSNPSKTGVRVLSASLSKLGS